MAQLLHLLLEHEHQHIHNRKLTRKPESTKMVWSGRLRVPSVKSSDTETDSQPRPCNQSTAPRHTEQSLTSLRTTTTKNQRRTALGLVPERHCAQIIQTNQTKPAYPISKPTRHTQHSKRNHTSICNIKAEKTHLQRINLDILLRQRLRLERIIVLHVLVREHCTRHTKKQDKKKVAVSSYTLAHSPHLIDTA